MNIASPAFAENQKIPQKYSAYFDNISPPLIFKDVPPACRSLALVMEDPDAPIQQPWQHWLVWNISPEIEVFEENELPVGCREGQNDSGQIGYYGPKPPHGMHRYIFILFALDNILKLANGSNRQQLEKSIEGHIIDQASLTGTYGSV